MIPQRSKKGVGFRDQPILIVMIFNTYNGNAWLKKVKKKSKNLNIYFAQLMHHRENTDTYS